MTWRIFLLGLYLLICVYFCWQKFIWPIWSLNLGLNNYFVLYIFFDIYIWTIFVFAWTLSWVRIYDTWSMEFHERKWDSKSYKWSIELFISLFRYTFYFPLLFGFIFIGFCKYLFVYIYLLCTELNIEQIRDFV